MILNNRIISRLKNPPFTTKKLTPSAGKISLLTLCRIAQPNNLSNDNQVRGRKNGFELEIMITTLCRVKRKFIVLK